LKPKKTFETRLELKFLVSASESSRLKLLYMRTPTTITIIKKTAVIQSKVFFTDRFLFVPFTPVFITLINYFLAQSIRAYVSPGLSKKTPAGAIVEPLTAAWLYHTSIFTCTCYAYSNFACIQ